MRILIYRLYLPPQFKKEAIVKGKSRDLPLRSIIKSISWRLLGTADTIIISYVLTGKLDVAFSIGTVELFTKMILYYFHERAWTNVRWGKKIDIEDTQDSKPESV